MRKFFFINFCVIQIILRVHQDHLLGLLVVRLLAKFAGDAGPQGEGLYDSVFGYHGSGGDDGTSADLCVIQDHRAHADEAAVAYGAAVERNRVAHRDPVAHVYAVFVTHAVQHAAILHAAIFADANGKDITTNHGVHPDAGIFANLNIANDLGGLVDIATLVNARRDSLIRTEHSSEF